MNKENVVKSCYSALGRLTPLAFDCGNLCGGRCCKGDEGTGMLLFPGEENLIDENINVIENDGFMFAVCNGTCNRRKRPLSCRIYPLFPLIKDNGEIEVVFDSRANCPLTLGELKIERRFVKAVKRVGKYLLLNDETTACYKDISQQVEEIQKFSEIFLK